MFKETPEDERPERVVKDENGYERNLKISWKEYVITDYDRTLDENGRYHSFFTLAKVRGFDPEKERKRLDERRTKISKSRPSGQDTKPQTETEDIKC
jgi:hypothetical protein